MGFGISCYGWLRRITFAACVLLFCVAGIASSFAQNSFAGDAKPAQTVVVRAGRLFDPTAGRMLDRPVIVIIGNKVKSVSNGNPPSISGATLIELGNTTLLPAFIHVHTHLTFAAGCWGNNGSLAMAMLRIWLFGIYLSSLESFYLDRDDPIWFTFLLAVFGLHYLARFRMRE